MPKLLSRAMFASVAFNQAKKFLESPRGKQVVAQAKAKFAKDFEDAGEAALQMADRGFMSGQPANEAQSSAPGRKQA